VVVSIIGILMSILLPSLVQAREKGMSALCLSNMRQSLLHATMYQSENRGPHHMLKHKSFSWAGIMNLSGNIKLGNRSFFCPKSKTYSEQNLIPWNYNYFSYGGNVESMDKSTNWAQRPWLERYEDDEGNGNYVISTLLIEQPSEFMFVIDSLSRSALENSGVYRNATAVFDGLGLARVWTVHSPTKKANMGFLDGHVTAQSVAKVKTLSPPSIGFDFE
jgi:prepilin-type processing-associated H-X9-DG protein